MIIYSIQSSPNTNYHQYQLINDDDDESKNSNELANVGMVNGHLNNEKPYDNSNDQTLNVEDEDEPFNAWVLIKINIFVSIVLTLSGHCPYSHSQMFVQMQVLLYHVLLYQLLHIMLLKLKMLEFVSHHIYPQMIQTQYIGSLGYLLVHQVVVLYVI
eukprot:451341_1